VSQTILLNKGDVTCLFVHVRLNALLVFLVVLWNTRNRIK